MGSKNFTIFLNIVGSGYKLGRCIPHPSVQNFRKLKRCANSNNYHISAQKLKEIQKHINEGKKESQKKLLSVSINDKSLEDKKEVFNDIEKIESVKISGTSELAADTSNQSNTGKTSLPSKPEKESRGSVQEEVSKTIGKLEGEKIYEENQTKTAIGLRNEKEKGRKLNMIDSIRREMKSSYSSLRKKQLQENPSISNLFESRNLSGDKDKTDTINDMNAKAFNTFDSIVSKQVESIKQTEKNDKQFKENTPKVTQIVEEEKTDIIKDMNTRAFDTFDSIVVSKRVESKQTEKSDNLFDKNSPQKTQIVEEGSIDKEKVNASGEKTKEKENKDLLKKDLFNKENIFLPQEKEVKSVGEKQIDKAEENILEEKSKISGKTVVLRSDESMSKTNLNVSVNEVDRPSTQKYMLNTLLDPIAKSSQKKVENRGLSSQSGEDLNEIKGSAGRKPQKIDEQVPEQKQKIDESIKPGMGNTKMEASNSTRLLLKENTEDNSQAKIVNRSDIISNQQVEQKNRVMPKVIAHQQSSISGEEMNKKEASTDLLEENIVKLSNKIKDQELERIMKQ
ncbi:hypothetical protein LSTR_LSTR014061 [Laodelphax striatellus]|uniref:Uncharacterized protein n=1 Tax=Laodelphax striatellus TaxID=195883 RepID=A0A482XHB2_LAOST|nr:hypothetical protein LSTR_LSTR014061 [Laodelphax striatellus]